jgi:hypothetical protein
MRSTLLFAALAVGTCAKVIEKEVYVTDWTTTTVTETVTQWPTTTANTANLVKQDTVVAEPSSSSSSLTSALPTVDLSKKTTAEPAPAATEDAAAANAGGATTWYSTTYWSIPAEPATTETPTSLATSTSAAAAATPTNAYQESILYNHNVHRSNHSASSVTWSESLESSARTLAERCVYKHDT